MHSFALYEIIKVNHRSYSKICILHKSSTDFAFCTNIYSRNNRLSDISSHFKIKLINENLWFWLVPSITLKKCLKIF